MRVGYFLWGRIKEIGGARGAEGDDAEGGGRLGDEGLGALIALDHDGEGAHDAGEGFMFQHAVDEGEPGSGKVASATVRE